MSVLNRMNKQDIQNIVYRNTPIDKINTIYEGYGFIEVNGRAGKDELTYRLYENGMVVEK
jgi:hypothetical protein